jgi:hypothetical protein
MIQIRLAKSDCPHPRPLYHLGEEPEIYISYLKKMYVQLATIV